MTGLIAALRNGFSVRTTSLMVWVPAALLIFVFETKEDLARLRKVRVSPEAGKEFLIEPDREHATQGASCIKVSFPSAAREPGMAIDGFPKDWSEYKWLKADVYTPSQALVRLEFRAEDARVAPGKDSGKDVLFWSQNMVPGKNTYAVSLADARTFDEMRFFDLRTVKSMMFFLDMRPDGTVLYFDNIRLEK